MIEAARDGLLGYLADIVERAERYGASVLSPNAADAVAWVARGDTLVMRVLIRPPVHPQSERVEIELRDRWRATGADRWSLAEYAYELRDLELGHRRALHRHHVDSFVRAFGVATHEHCEAPIGHAPCPHHRAEPCAGAIDGLERLYGLWLSGTRADCRSLRCLG